MALSKKTAVKVEMRLLKDACPTATQDIVVNLRNRQICVDKANYGPLNPEEDNEAYWARKALQFKTTIAEARRAVCGNCAAFVQTPEILQCIVNGIDPDEEGYAKGVADLAGLGYCELFDFKCAAERTCDAWLVGGPMRANVAKEGPTVADVHVPTIMGATAEAGRKRRRKKRPKGGR